MVIVYQTDKGYTMLQMLISLCIITSLSLLYLNFNHTLELKHLQFMNDYLLLQSLSMKDKQDVIFEKGIRFNSMGHVNQGRSISFNRHDVIVHLGNGYLTYE